jgi:hypothetical protein
MMQSDLGLKPWYLDAVRVNEAGSNLVDWYAGNSDAE